MLIAPSTIPEEFIMTNFVGTYRLLDAFRRYALETGRMSDARLRFLHVSTDEVFGSLGPDDPAFLRGHCPTRRTVPTAPPRRAAIIWRVPIITPTDLPVITTNCSNNYGPYQFPEKLLPLMIRKTLKGEPLPVYGDGNNVRDWLYVEDHCRGLAMALIPRRPRENLCHRRQVRDEEYRCGAGHHRNRSRTGSRQELTKSADELITFVKDRPGS